MAKKIKSVLIVILALGLLGVGASYLTNGFKEVPKVPEFLKTGNPDRVAENTIKYINENLLQGQAKAELKEVSRAHGLYKMKFSIDEREITSYATKDGKMLFPEAIEMKTATGTESEENGEGPGAEIPKEEKATVELFVMSFCPYGNQAEQTMEPVYELLGDKVDWNIHYITKTGSEKIADNYCKSYVDNNYYDNLEECKDDLCLQKNGEWTCSMHGKPEISQNKRELCVLKNQGLEKWFGFANYVNENCGSKGNCWEEGAKENDLEPEKISSCAEEDGVEMQKEEAQISEEKGASGSPTLLINGTESDTVYEYGSANAYKEAICSGFEEPPAECEEELESADNTESNGGSC